MWGSGQSQQGQRSWGPGIVRGRVLGEGLMFRDRQRSGEGTGQDGLWGLVSKNG